MKYTSLLFLPGHFKVDECVCVRTCAKFSNSLTLNPTPSGKVFGAPCRTVNSNLIGRGGCSRFRVEASGFEVQG